MLSKISVFLSYIWIFTFLIAGGAPELCPTFRPLVSNLRKLSDDVTIIDRCNLTALLEPG